MQRHLYRGLGVAMVLWGLGACASTQPQVDIDATAATLDFGDYRSVTLMTKAWEAQNAKRYPQAVAFTREIVTRYAAEARRMNRASKGFEVGDAAHELWALNDVGTALFVMGEAYEKLGLLGEAAAAFDRLGAEFNYAQCWDPKGWFWRPAEGAKDRARELRLKASAR